MLHLKKPIGDLLRKFDVTEPTALARNSLVNHRRIRDLPELAEMLDQRLGGRVGAQPANEDLAPARNLLHAGSWALARPLALAPALGHEGLEEVARLRGLGPVSLLQLLLLLLLDARR